MHQFKADVLCLSEKTVNAIIHEATSYVAILDGIQGKYVCDSGLTDSDAFLDHNLAPQCLCRDIGSLGFAQLYLGWNIQKLVFCSPRHRRGKCPCHAPRPITAQLSTFGPVPWIALAATGTVAVWISHTENEMRMLCPQRALPQCLSNSNN